MLVEWGVKEIGMILLEGEAKEIDKSSQQNEGYRQGALTTSSVSKQYVVYRPLF